MNIARLKVRDEKNEFKKFLLREGNFLRELESYISDGMITTKRKIKDRRKKIRSLFEGMK